MEVNKIYHNDWMNNQLPDKSVQLIIADPPYFEVKGSFDFVWKSFDEYLIDVEKWAIECKRLLADNGTLFWYGNSKKIAYSQIIIDKYFNLENSLVWRKKDSIQYQYYSPDLARTFNTHNERLLMYSNESDGINLAELNYSYQIGRKHTEIMEPLISYMIGEMEKAGFNCAKINQATKSKMASHWFARTSQWALPTKEWYIKLQELFNYEYLRKDYEYLRKDYEELRKDYEELRKDYEELRRFFYNPNKYEEVLEFSQEGHKTGKYDHDTCKPETLTRALILTCSRPNDLVFIPFAGSGTEVAMAIKEGRNAIGFDIEEKYVEMGNKRTNIIKAQPSLFVGS
jgi:site-specific DNA-methyltransferase (adenine-specific)